MSLSEGISQPDHPVPIHENIDHFFFSYFFFFFPFVSLSLLSPLVMLNSLLQLLQAVPPAVLVHQRILPLPLSIVALVRGLG